MFKKVGLFHIAMSIKKFDNTNLIKRFINACYAEGLGERRIAKYEQLLKKLSDILCKNFDKADRQDIENLVAYINKNSDWAEWTKYGYKVAIKKFYRWLNGGEECPPVAKWIKPRVSRLNNKLPEDLLSEEEVKKMVEFATSIRDKAFIMTLYETGCRIGEMLSIQLKHVIFESHGTTLRVHGKTGERRVIVILSTPYLRDWINNHPYHDNRNAFLWVTTDHNPFNHATAAALLKRIASKAKIKNKVNPHNFRHSRATHLANHLTEAQMKSYLGWTQASKMASTYVHLSGRDTDNAILKMHGMKTEAHKTTQKLKPLKCMRCSEINKSTSKFCDKCGAVLDLKTAVVFDEKRKGFDDIASELFKDEKVQEAVVKSLIEKGLGKEMISLWNS